MGQAKPQKLLPTQFLVIFVQPLFNLFKKINKINVHNYIPAELELGCDGCDVNKLPVVILLLQTALI